MNSKDNIKEVTLDPDDYQEIANTAKIRFPEIERIILFGSRAIKTARPGSDIDLAIYGENVTRATKLEFYDWLNKESNIPFKINVLQLNELDNADMITLVEEKGKVIFERV